MKLCFKNLHFYMVVYFLVTHAAICFADQDCGRSPASISRKPANFVPDDDLIVVPLVIEKNVYERFNEKHESRFKIARERLNFWMKQEEYAEAYGLEGTGAVQLPTQAQKEKFLQRNYLRFLSKDVERYNNQSLQNTWQRWTADDELDAIEAQEQHEKVLVFAKKKKGKKDFKKTKTVKVGKDKIRFGFQPRLEIGMVKFDMRTPYFRAKAWLGVNGNQEVNIEKRIGSIGTKLRANYLIDESRVLCAVDQHISGPWSLRLSHTKEAEGFSELMDTGKSEDNVSQLRFSLSF